MSCWVSVVFCYHLAADIEDFHIHLVTTMYGESSPLYSKSE